jgi:hypothetical protein
MGRGIVLLNGCAKSPLVPDIPNAGDRLYQGKEEVCAVAQAEAEGEPHAVADDLWRKPMALMQVGGDHVFMRRVWHVAWELGELER